MRRNGSSTMYLSLSLTILNSHSVTQCSNVALPWPFLPPLSVQPEHRPHTRLFPQYVQPLLHLELRSFPDWKVKLVQLSGHSKVIVRSSGEPDLSEQHLTIADQLHVAGLHCLYIVKHPDLSTSSVHNSEKKPKSNAFRHPTSGWTLQAINRFLDTG